MTHLFRPITDPRKLGLTGIFASGRESDVAISAGFVHAADLVVDSWVKDRNTDDSLLVPIVFNYRHALELALKVAVRTAERGLEPDQRREDLNEWFAKEVRHNLAKLAFRLKTSLELWGLDAIDESTRKTIEQLHSFDKSGDSFRYSTAPDGAANKRPSDPHVDVEHLAAELKHAVNHIHSVNDEMCYRLGD